MLMFLFGDHLQSSPGEVGNILHVSNGLVYDYAGNLVVNAIDSEKSRDMNIMIRNSFTL